MLGCAILKFVFGTNGDREALSAQSEKGLCYTHTWEATEYVKVKQGLYQLVQRRLTIWVQLFKTNDVFS